MPCLEQRPFDLGKTIKKFPVKDFLPVILDKLRLSLQADCQDSVLNAEKYLPEKSATL